MRRVSAVAFACVQAALLALSTSALAERACPAPPCDLKKDGRAACEAKATWILEGSLESLVDGFARDCARFGDLRECLAPGWAGATAYLRELNAVKMPIHIVIDGPPLFAGYGNATVFSANKCWEKAIRLPTDAPTRRVRFYGMDKYPKAPFQLHGWSPSASRDGGYFAYEFIP